MEDFAEAKPFRYHLFGGPAVCHYGMAEEECAARKLKRGRAPEQVAETCALVGVDLEEEAAAATLQQGVRRILTTAEDAFFERLTIIAAVQAGLSEKSAVVKGGQCCLRVEPVFPHENRAGWLLKVEIVEKRERGTNETGTHLVVALSRPPLLGQKERITMLSFDCPYALSPTGELGPAAKRELFARVAQLTNEILKSVSLRPL